MIENSGEVLLDIKLIEAFKMWEETSYELEKIQSNKITADEEFSSLENRFGPVYSYNFELQNATVISGMLYYLPI